MIKDINSAIHLCIGVVLIVVGTVLRSIFPMFMPLFIIMLGTAWLVYGIIHLGAARKIKWVQWLKKIYHIGLLLLAISFVIIEGYILLNDDTTATYNEKYVIALGAGLIGDVPSDAMASRMAGVEEYMLRNPRAIAIVCGAQGKTETITEAEAFRRGLEKRGIPPQRIIMEDESCNTSQNLANAIEIIKEREGTLDVDCAVLTNDFHLWRGLFYGRKYGLDAKGVSIPTPGIYVNIECRLREYFSAIKAWCGLDMDIGFK